MADHLTLDKPAIYHIEIQGALSPHWADYLGGLEINNRHQQDSTLTTLEGEIMDQAALLGVLNSLYNLGFPLLAVEYQSIPKEEKT